MSAQELFPPHRPLCTTRQLGRGENHFVVLFFVFVFGIPVGACAEEKGSEVFEPRTAYGSGTFFSLARVTDSSSVVPSFNA